MELTKQNFNEKVELAPERPGKDQAYTLDSEKLTELNWEDKYLLPMASKVVT